MKKVLAVFAKTIYGAVVLAVVCLALLFIGTKIDFFGYEVRVVQSGSMEPVIQTGSIVIIAPQKDYGVGDIITYRASANNSLPVTHRIIGETGNGSRKSFETKGDANQDADPRGVSKQNVIGEVVYSIPYIGYALAFARTPLGFTLLIGIPAAVIILDELADITWEFHKYRRNLRQSRHGKVGYRTPSRQRRPRDAGKPPAPTPKRVPPKAPVVQKRVAPPQRPMELDLRNYELKRRSV